MGRSSLFVTALVFSALLLAGCQSSRPCPNVIQYTANNLLFNPECTQNSVDEVARADWPVTTAFDHQREEFTYRETIIDRQGRHGASQDYAYRRFDSVRTGRTRR